MRRLLPLLLLVALLGGGAYWFLRGGGEAVRAPQAADAGARAVPVVTRPVEVRPVPEELGTIGTVQPLAAVGIKARVDSVVQEVHFQEGREVKAGDLLFTLDARALEAQLEQAQANLERDQANLEKARNDLRRYSELIRSNTVARQQVDAAVADANALEATVKADQAAIDAARVSLSFTRITAPMDGRTGTVTAKPGAAVRAADAEPLVTLTQLRPISVAFDLPERFLPTVRRAMSAGKLKVRAAIPGSSPSGEDGPPVEGELYFVDSQVDQQSGTILVKALFANEETRLWPGQFVNVVLTLRVEDRALTLPDTAVQTGQQGRYVYLVRPDGTVEMRVVTVSRSHGGLAVLSAGVAAGDRVVTEGQSRLFPGARVTERADGGSGGGAKGEGKSRDRGKGDGAAVGTTSGDEGKRANGSPA